jgi:hypothetical protein
MNKKTLFKSALKYFPLLMVFAIIASFAFIGAECSTLVNGNTSEKNRIYNKWILNRQTGRLLDICPFEIIIFYSGDSFVRTTCGPYLDTLIREYVIDDNEKTITFIPSQVAYRWAIKDSTPGLCLNLYGINVDRNLYYQKLLPASVNTLDFIDDVIGVNFSELSKKELTK